jgi:hypothetical protein
MAYATALHGLDTLSKVELNEVVLILHGSGNCRMDGLEAGQPVVTESNDVVTNFELLDVRSFLGDFSVNSLMISGPTRLLGLMKFRFEWP